MIQFVSLSAVTFKTYIIPSIIWDMLFAITHSTLTALSAGFLWANCPFSKSMKWKLRVDSNLIKGQTIHEVIHYVHSGLLHQKELKVKIIGIVGCANSSSTKCVITYNLTNQITSTVLLFHRIRHRGLGSSEIHRRLLGFGGSAHRH